MLHKQLAAYLAEVEAAVKQHTDAYVERYEEEILASDRVNLRLRIRFASGYLLEVSEAVVVTGNVLHRLGLTATEKIVGFNSLSSYNNFRSQEPTASWAESNACREGVRPGGTCGRLISVKFPTRGEFEWRKPSRTPGQPRGSKK